MWDLRLNSLRALAAVYSSGGVRAAARVLGIAHSSVSRHLIELEDWLGVELTVKGGGRRPLSFTPQGKALGEAALDGQRRLASVVASIQEARSASSVQIGTRPSVAARWLLPRLPEFEASHPGIEVSVIVDRRLSDLEGTEIDVAIRMSSTPPADARWQPLMGDALYPVMTGSFWKRSGRPSKPADLVGLRLLHDRDPHASWAEWRRIHGPENLDVRKGPRFTSTDLVLRAAAQSQGVALARHQLAADDVSSGLLLRPLGELSVELDNAYWIEQRPHTIPSRAAVAVIEWLKREAKRPRRPDNDVFGRTDDED